MQATRNVCLHLKFARFEEKQSTEIFHSVDSNFAGSLARFVILVSPFLTCSAEQDTSKWLAIGCGRMCRCSKHTAMLANSYAGQSCQQHMTNQLSRLSHRNKAIRISIYTTVRVVNQRVPRRLQVNKTTRTSGDDTKSQKQLQAFLAGVAVVKGITLAKWVIGMAPKRAIG